MDAWIAQTRNGSAPWDVWIVILLRSGCSMQTGKYMLSVFGEKMAFAQKAQHLR